MENNVNRGWEPEEKQIFSMPDNDGQREFTDNTIPGEETLPDDDDVEEGSLEDDEPEEPGREDGEVEEPWKEDEDIEEPGKENEVEDEIDTDESNSDKVYNKAQRNSL